MDACEKVKKRNPLFSADLKQNLLFEVNLLNGDEPLACHTLGPGRHLHNVILKKHYYYSHANGHLTHSGSNVEWHQRMCCYEEIK